MTAPGSILDHARRRTSRLRRMQRPALGAVLLALLLVAVAHPLAVAGNDALSNVAPASQLPDGSLANSYPLGNYALDHHFDAVDAGVFSGVDVSGIAPTIAWFLAQIVWMLTAFLANAVIVLFTFAFSLDLVNGSSATGGAGALAPVGDAVRTIYRDVFGQPWLVLAVLLTGMWAMWNALVRRRYTETAGALAVSLIFVTVALAFVTRPEIVGQASAWTNRMSTAFLSLSTSGDLTNPQRAKQANADQLFNVLIFEPWTVLNFGGLEHCVTGDGDDQRSVPVRPLSSNPARDAVLSRRLAAGTEIQADGKVCVNHRNKYAPHFLDFVPETAERKAQYEALKDGDPDKLPDADRGKYDGSYQLGEVDKPAADAMGKGGQYQRLLLAVVIFLGQLGAFVLLGALSVAVILAQVLVLLLLAFAPVALVLGVFPGRGHDFFKAWLARLATYLVRKAIYSLLLAVLLAVASALADATASLGWLMAFGLQAVFFWTVLLNRNKLAGPLSRATTGDTAPVPDAAGRIAAVTYAAARFANRDRAVARRPPSSSSGSDPAAAPQPPDPQQQTHDHRESSERPDDPARGHDGDRRDDGEHTRTDPPLDSDHSPDTESSGPTRPDDESAVPRDLPPQAGDETAASPDPLETTEGDGGGASGHRPPPPETTSDEATTASDVPDPQDSHVAPDLPEPIRRPTGPHGQDGPATDPSSTAPDLPDDPPERPPFGATARRGTAGHDAVDASPSARNVTPESPLREGLHDDERRLHDRPAETAVPDVGERPHDAGPPSPPAPQPLPPADEETSR